MSAALLVSLTGAFTSGGGAVLVAERSVRLPDGRTVFVGSIHDAAEICDIHVNTYRAYQRDGRLPGPVQVPSFMTPGALTALRDDDGEPQYDLNGVRDANRARPGSGRRVDPADVSTVRWSARRQGILRDARAGRLVVGDDGRVDLSLLVDAPTASKNDQVRTRRAVQRLRDTGAFVGPDGSGRLTLSPYGDRVLSTFLRMDHPQRPLEE